MDWFIALRVGANGGVCALYGKHRDPTCLLTSIMVCTIHLDRRELTTAQRADAHDSLWTCARIHDHADVLIAVSNTLKPNTQDGRAQHLQTNASVFSAIIHV